MVNPKGTAHFEAVPFGIRHVFRVEARKAAGKLFEKTFEMTNPPLRKALRIEKPPQRKALHIEKPFTAYPMHLPASAPL